MRGYPQFSFWIPIALAKICFSCIVIKGTMVELSFSTSTQLVFILGKNQSASVWGDLRVCKLDGFNKQKMANADVPNTGHTYHFYLLN